MNNLIKHNNKTVLKTLVNGTGLGILNMFWFFLMGAFSVVQAEMKVVEGVLAPGGFVIMQVSPPRPVTFQRYTLKPDAKGRVLLGFGRDAKLTQILKVMERHKDIEKKVLHLQPRTYTVQKINGLPKNKVTPDKVTQSRIWRDIKLAKQARRLKLPKPYFESGFIWPTSGVISGIYGSQRILNGHPRRPHLGVDIAAPQGTPIVAPADGKITLNKNMELSGNTVMIDHGWGLRSTVMHLHKVFVKKGQEVRKGQLIGEVGMTGRATGSHVHWGMSWFNTRLDPSLAILSHPTLKPGDKVVSPATQK